MLLCLTTLILSLVPQSSAAKVYFQGPCVQATCPDGPGLTTSWVYPNAWFRDPVIREVKTNKKCKEKEACMFRFRKWSDHLVAFVYWDFIYKYEMIDQDMDEGNDYQVTCLGVRIIQVTLLFCSRTRLRKQPRKDIDKPPTWAAACKLE